METGYNDKFGNPIKVGNTISTIWGKWTVSKHDNEFGIKMKQEFVPLQFLTILTLEI